MMKFGIYIELVIKYTPEHPQPRNVEVFLFFKKTYEFVSAYF